MPTDKNVTIRIYYLFQDCKADFLKYALKILWFMF
jgi:hypothetical protein